MNNIKMSDVFDLPIKCTGKKYDDNGCIYHEIIDFTGGEVLGEYGLCDAETDAPAICEAVNNHDRLLEENEKLKELLYRITSTISAGNTKCDGVDFPKCLLMEAENLIEGDNNE